MGEVYRASDTRLGRDVAIKVLPAHLAQDPGALARFEREARAVAALSHSNILAIHDFGMDQGVAYAVMELLDGETLRDRLARGPIPWRKAIGTATELAEALAAAHDKRIVHRDLKPENIFLTSAGQAKILDFGLARVKGARRGDTTVAPITSPGTVLGTVGYMSPEQVRGEESGAASDIFSFGCVLHEMLAGQAPFARPTSGETMAAVLRDEPPALPDEIANVPAVVQAIVAHALEKRPEDRLVWIDRRGRAEPLAAEPSFYSSPRLSPEGRRVAVEALNDIWVYHVGDGTLSRVTFRGVNQFPVWAPDGQHFIMVTRAGDAARPARLEVILDWTERLQRRLQAVGSQ